MTNETTKVTYDAPFDWDFEEQNIIIPITSGSVTEDDVNNAVSEAMSKITLKDNGDMTYSLMVDGNEAGVINLPEDQFLKSASYNTETHKLTLEFHTSNGDTTTEIDLSDLVDAYSAGEGIKIENGVISTTFNIADYVKASDLEEKINEINTTIETKANKEDIADMETKTNAAATYQVKGDYITEETDPLYSADKETLALKSEIPTVPENVSAFTNDAGYLTEHQSLENYVTETELEEKGYLTEHQDLSEYAKTTDVEGLLETKANSDEVYTKAEIDDKGYLTEETDPVYVADKENLATKTEIETLTSVLKNANSTIKSLTVTIDIVSAKLDAKDNVEKVIYDETTTLNDTTVDYVVSGTIVLETAGSVDMTSKSLTLNDATVEENTRLNVKSEYTAFNNTTVSGSLAKATANARVSVNNSEVITFNNVIFDDTVTGYNSVEIALSNTVDYLPKTIVFNGCEWNGTMSNNAIIIFGTQDNAVIELNNCKFNTVSNVLRLSNKTNATGITVNINNCTVEQWDTSDQWAGFLLFEDYTSVKGETETNNLFAPEKITVNFKNLYYKDVKVLPDNVSDVCGNADADTQVVCMCYDKETPYVRTYDTAYWPTISFE